MSLIQELSRRNVWRAAAAYIVTAWLVIQVVETIFPAFGFGDTAVRIVVIIFAVAFVPAMVAAWIFEWTPDGFRREHEVDDKAPTSVALAKRVDRMIMIVLALALGLFAFDKFALDPARDDARVQQATREAAEKARAEALTDSYGDKSIAVLAFEDLSEQGTEEYFALGISEELLNLLARIPDLRVAGRTSSFSFRGKNATIVEIGAALDVAHILEGSVRRAGDKLRITAQLIHASSDTHLWSETFDRQLGDIFAIQDEIAATIVEALHLELAGTIARQKPVDPKAYAFYLQARTILNGNYPPEELERVPELLEQALANDPEYGDAILLFSRFKWIVGEPGKTELEIYQDVRRTINRELLRGPNNANALSWAGFIALVLDNDIETASRLMERAHAASPLNYELLWASLTSLPAFGRSDLAAEIGEYVLRRDPLCFNCRASLARAYLYLGDYDKAEQTIKQGVELDPNWHRSVRELSEAYVLQGRPEEALAVAEDVPESAREGENIFLLPGTLLALHDAGRTEEFRALLPEFIELHEAAELPLVIAEVFAWIGDVDTAFYWLQKHSTVNTWGIRSHLIRPWYEKLHGDPRWNALLERYGMTAEQIEAINLNPKLPPRAE